MRWMFGVCCWGVLGSACLPTGRASAVPPTVEWWAAFASSDDAGHAVWVRRGDAVVAQASAREPLALSVRGPGVTAHRRGYAADVRRVATAGGRVHVRVRQPATAGGVALSRPPSARVMIAVEPALSARAADGADDLADGAGWLTRRQHLLLATFGVNPTALRSRTGLALARALDVMAALARRTPADRARPARDVRDVHVDGGYRLEYTRTVDGHRVEVSREVHTGREVLRLMTRFDRETGRVHGELTLSATDRTRVEAMLAVDLALPPEYSALPTDDPVGAYLAARPDAGGPLDDFRDLTGEQPLREYASDEGFASFVDGAVLGSFGDNDSWSAIGGQTAVGFVPIAGQIADARDIYAAGMDVRDGRDGAWVALGVSIVAIIPGLDFLKTGRAASNKALREASKTALDGAAGATMKRIAKLISRESADRAAETLRELNVGRVELIARCERILLDPAVPDAIKNNVIHMRNALQDHLKPADLAGALRDRLGVPVRKPGSGVPYDHGQEVNDALKAFNGRREDLNRVFQRMRIASEVQGAISREMDAISEMMRLVDQFLKIR